VKKILLILQIFPYLKCKYIWYRELFKMLSERQSELYWPKSYKNCSKSKRVVFCVPDFFSNIYTKCQSIWEQHSKHIIFWLEKNTNCKSCRHNPWPITFVLNWRLLSTGVKLLKKGVENCTFKHTILPKTQIRSRFIYLFWSRELWFMSSVRLRGGLGTNSREGGASITMKLK
jgi:hypothetical protein